MNKQFIIRIPSGRRLDTLTEYEDLESGHCANFVDDNEINYKKLTENFIDDLKKIIIDKRVKKILSNNDIEDKMPNINDSVKINIQK